ncbi:hypothetical protein SAY87_000745 [Trapa incisa]|uniref:Serine/threonine-protein phosphatase 4 regulatory subunit 3-like central domain-containing protein n=1 Tax=Trapa incisa TaxID=236973 RepID=A0AAN7GJE1_9MYRT|nr:hypothetical protein SAY87_000745 [Trapa incisa]
MGQQEKSPANSNPMQRVKVYYLNDDGKWDDQGTGDVSVDYLEKSEDLGLFVFDAEDNETLLMHRIRAEDIYRKQEDSIIAWKDPDYATELALSFQEPAGCSYIWDHLSSVQRNLQFSAINGNTFQSMNSDLRELPTIELASLPLLHKMVIESGIADQMRLTELLLHDQDFFRKLMELFRVCEDLENLEGLHMIYRIIKGIILLNSPQIFEKIFGDELIMDIIGSLEYDPEVSQVQHHRNFLKEHVVFKEEIPIKDSIVLSKIHQTYRVGYLQDVILTRVLDEATIGNLKSIIHSNNAVVVSLLKDDSTFIQELFARLKSPTTSSDSKKNLVYFLHDFCNLSKSLPMVQQLRLFRDLVNEGIFDILKDALHSRDNRLVLTGTDILILFLNQDPNLLRSYVVRPEGIPLLGLLVEGMITDFGDDMHCQFLEILRSLLDSHTLSGQSGSIIEIFYEKHLGQLIDVIITSCPSGGTPSYASKSSGSLGVKLPKNTKPEILSNICELLCFCVMHHPYRIKCNLLLTNFLDKVLLLLHRREKYLVVAAVRFIRTVLSRHDEHLIFHIIRNNLLKPIIDAFLKNGNRYNLLNSTVLDLFEYIRKENMKLLIIYIVNSFWKDLVKFEHLESLQAFKVKFEQSQDSSGSKSTGNISDPRRRIDERALEKEEEAYFNEDSDEEDTASASLSCPEKTQPQPVRSNGVSPSSQPISKSRGLVDYEDDEDDGDYRPPPRKQPEATDEDGGAMETFMLKRKPARERETEMMKKQRLNKNPKSKDSVFAALCSTLSQAVLPVEKGSKSARPSSPKEGNPNKSSGDKEGQSGDKEGRLAEAASSGSPPDNSRPEEKTRNEEPSSHRSCSDSLQMTSSDSTRQMMAEEIPLVPSPPKSSPEMALNGSSLEI